MRKGWRDFQSESIVSFERIPPLGLHNMIIRRRPGVIIYDCFGSTDGIGRRFSIYSIFNN